MLILIVAFLIYCLRVYPFILHPQFFCEDGTVFFVDAYNEGFGSLFYPYAGYLVFYQRLVAFIGTSVSATFAPSLYLFAALVIPFLLLAEILKEQTTPDIRLISVIIFLIAPFDGTTLATLCNSQWLLSLYLMRSACLSSATQKIGKLECLLLVTAALTGPFVIFLFPIFLCRLFIDRGVGSWQRFLLSAVCVGIQLISATDMIAPRSALADLSAEGNWFAVISMLLSYPTYKLVATGLSQGEAGWAAVVGFSCLVASIPALLLVLAIQKRDKQSLCLLLSGVLVVGATILAYLNDPLTLTFRERYALLPTLAFLWAGSRMLYDHAKGVLALLLLPLFVSGFLNFFSQPLPDLKWGAASQCIGGSTQCAIPLNWQERYIGYFPESWEASGRVGRLENLAPIQAYKIGVVR